MGKNIFEGRKWTKNTNCNVLIRQRESSCFVSSGLLVRKTINILYIYIYIHICGVKMHMKPTTLHET